MAQILRNILTEACEHEVELTSRFRAIVLPPVAKYDQPDREKFRDCNLPWYFHYFVYFVKSPLSVVWYQI